MQGVAAEWHSDDKEVGRGQVLEQAVKATESRMMEVSKLQGMVLSLQNESTLIYTRTQVIPLPRRPGLVLAPPCSGDA